MAEKIKHPDYYEAVLQLRNCGKEIIDFAESNIAEKGIKAAKIIKMEEGKDYYLTDKNFTKALGRKLQERFGGEYKVTASLWGRKKDKEVYRLTVLFRGLSFQKGDRVNYKGEEYEVKMMGKDMLLQQAKTGKKAHVKYSEREKIKKKG